MSELLREMRASLAAAECTARRTFVVWSCAHERVDNLQAIVDELEEAAAQGRGRVDQAAGEEVTHVAA